MIDWIRKHGQTLVNWIVFVGIGRWILLKAIQWHSQGQLLHFVELTFLAHMALLLVLVVIRRRHVEIDTNPFHQAVALVAFFSGLAYMGQWTDNQGLLWSSRVVMGFALVLGLVTQVNLGRSFGILISRRAIKTHGLYGILRHPMYATDLLYKVGMFLKLVSWFNAVILLLGAACYVYRAILEERFLARTPVYREYMKDVRYRFIPGLF